jgi:hypothetical protein
MECGGTVKYCPLDSFRGKYNTIRREQLPRSKLRLPRATYNIGKHISQCQAYIGITRNTYTYNKIPEILMKGKWYADKDTHAARIAIMN